MTVKNTESLANSSSETRSVFYCPRSPHFIWDLNHTTSFKVIVAITTIACPVTILLNLLVIIAVKTRRELKRISNFLLSSVALADLLVGAVSMSLTITLDALVLENVSSEDIICTIDSVSDFVQYTFYCASFFHLLLIAWERYVVIVKWMKYKAIVTKGRLRKYVRVAWLSAFHINLTIIIMETLGVGYELMLAVDVSLSVFWVALVLLIAYFYAKVYLEVRKWNRTKILPVNALVERKLETNIAYTTAWLTLFVGISGLPTLVVYLLRGASFLRGNSSFRLVETMLQLNSLFNPLLYWYRNRQSRKAALELLRCRKSQRITSAARTARRIRRRRYSETSLDVEKICNRQNDAVLQDQNLTVL